MQTKFENPYINGDPTINISKTGDEGKSCRVTFSVHETDKLLLKLARPHVGTETTVMTILYREFCQALRKRGLTDMTTSQQLEEFVCGLTLSYEQPKRRK